MVHKSLRGRLLVFAGILLVALSLRMAVTAVPPLLTTIGHDIPISPATAGLLGMVPTAAFAIFGFLTPYIVRWASLEKLVVLAMVLAVLGQVARTMTSNAAVFLLLTLLALAGLGAGNVLLPPLVRKYFPDRIGLMTALYVTGVSLGTTIPPYFAVPVADAAGWKVSTAMWAGVSVLAILPWLGRFGGAKAAVPPARLPAGSSGPGAAVRSHTVGRKREAGEQPKPANPTEPANLTEPATPTGTATPRRRRVNLWRSPGAIGLTLMMGCTSLNTYALFAWLPAILTDAGLSRASAGNMLGLFALVGMPLSLIVPVLAGRMRNPFPLVVVFMACFVGGYLGLMLVPGSGTWLWVSLAGLGPGSFPLSLVLINLRSRTPEVTAALSGFTQGIGYALACTGPLLMGLLRDSSGTWTQSYLFLGATLVLLTAGAWFGCRPRMVDDGPGVVCLPGR